MLNFPGAETVSSVPGKNKIKVKGMIDYQKNILAEISTSFLAVKTSELQAVVSRIHSSGRIFCDGLGRSALAMRGFAMRLTQLGFQSSLVGEPTAPAFGTDDTLVICTASGSSPVLLYHAQLAKKQQGSVILITGNPQATLAELANEIIVIPASNKDSLQAERSSIQPMGSLFEQTSQLVCDVLVLKLMEEFGISAEDMRTRHANIE